jgi:uncharacterized protein (UPF0276 family)
LVIAWRFFYNDLLPLPYTEETLARIVEHIDLVQTTLGREMQLENPSTYVAFVDSTIPETEFLTEIARRSGCGLLLDVNNVFISAKSWHRPVLLSRCIPNNPRKEIHLGGMTNRPTIPARRS